MADKSISGAGPHASAAATDRIPATKAGVAGYLTASQLASYVGAVGSATNLGATADASTVTISSSTGTSAVVPAVTSSAAGVVSANLPTGFYDTIYTGIGTVSSGTVTPDIANGNEQAYTNNGGHTLNPPAVAAGKRVRMCITVTNGASAGSITTIGFDQSETSALTSTNGNVFDCYILADNAFSSIVIKARQ